MSDAEFLEAMRAGLLVGIPVGAVIYAAVREAWTDFKRWRYELFADRERVAMLRRAERQVLADARMIRTASDRNHTRIV